MGNTRRMTPVHIEMLREIEKHPTGTPPAIIYKNFDSQTWEVLRNPNHKKGEHLAAGEVFQLLCQLVQNPKMFEKVEVPEEKKEIKAEPTKKIQNELDLIINNAMLYFNEEMQNAIEDISQTVFNDIKKKLNTISSKNR